MQTMQFGDLVLSPIQQPLHTECIEDVRQETAAALKTSPLFEQIKPGETVCIGVPSRGISCIVPVLQSVVDELRAIGAQPFIVPAMGSHGSGTAAGQREVLAGYGITPETIGVPIHSDIEAVRVGDLLAGNQTIPLYWDSFAAQADHVLVINRIKEHTAFTGPVESGLMKILALGLGKPAGAKILHQTDLAATIPAAAQWLMDHFPVLGGVAIIENGRHQPMVIEPVPAQSLAIREPQLLEIARTVLPRIPFEDLDVLIIGEMGKDISGTGMDTNVIGKYRRNWGKPIPNYRTIVVLNLTEASHGNATGVGFADIITQQLYDKIDLAATRLNCLTAGNFNGAKIPMIARDTEQAVEWALQGMAIENARVVYIESTLALETLWLSPGLMEEMTRQLAAPLLS